PAPAAAPRSIPRTLRTGRPSEGRHALVASLATSGRRVYRSAPCRSCASERFGTQLLQPLDVLKVGPFAIHARYLEQKRHLGEGGVPHDREEPFSSDVALADVFVPVAYPAERRLAVVCVHHRELVQPDLPV